MLSPPGVVRIDALFLWSVCGSLSQTERYHTAAAALQKQNKLSTALHMPIPAGPNLNQRAQADKVGYPLSPFSQDHP